MKRLLELFRKFSAATNPLAIFLLISSVLIATVGLTAGITSLIDSRSDSYMNVAGTVPLPDETLGDKIIIFFDRKIDVRPDQFRSVFSIEPQIEGTGKTGPNFLMFTPHQKPATGLFKVSLKNTLKSVDGKAINPQQSNFTFLAAFLQSNHWIQEQTQDSLKLSVTFNYPVSPDDLRKALHIKDAKNTVLPFIMSEGPNNQSFILDIQQAQLDWPIKYSLKPPLLDASQKIDLKKIHSQTISWDNNYRVKGCEYWKNRERNSRVFTLRFSNKVHADVLKNNLKITSIPGNDSISFEVLTRDYQDSHDVQVFPPDINRFQANLHLPQGMTGEKGRILQREYDTKLEYIPKPLTIESAYFYNRGKEGLALNINANFNLENTLDELNQFIEIIPALSNKRITYAWSNRNLYIYGDWKQETSYQITFNQGIKYNQDFTTDYPITRSVKTDSIRPSARFGIEGKYYFPQRTKLHLPLITRNIKEVNLTLYRVFPSNLPTALRDLNNGDGSPHFNNSWCEQISQKKITIQGNDYEEITTAIDLDNIFPEQKRGIFCLQANSPGHTQTTKIILYTDIGLLTHWTNNQLAVFAHDLFSLEPMSGAKVTVYSHKNQILGHGITDSQGIALLSDLASPKGHPSTIVIEKENDLTFLELRNRPVNASEVPNWHPLYQRDAYDAFIYADRDLYRPGETIHANWIVRTNYGDAVPDVPLLLTVVKPNNKNLFSRPVTLSELGGGTMDIETQKEYPTGKYQIQLSVPGSNSPIGRYSFNLEEFVPQRMKAEVKVAEDNWLPAKDYQINVFAKHLFGSPASERKCSVKVLFKRGAYQPEQWKGFHFDNDSKHVPNSVSLGENWSDTNGRADFNFNYTPSNDITFPMQAIVIGEVSELGGRSVASKANATFFPSTTILGIAATPNKATGGIDVFAAAIQPDQAAAQISHASVTLEKETWNYYVRRYHSYNSPNWTKKYQTIKTVSIPLSEGKGQTYFDVKEYGQYRIKVHSDATPQFSTLNFYCNGIKCFPVKSSQPSLVKIQADQSSYNVGDTAVFRIESPFNGQGLVVIQTDEIQKMIPVSIKDNVGKFSVKLTEKDYPNIWIEASVIHEVDSKKSQVYPFSSFTAKTIKVNDPKRKLKVEFSELPEEIRPAQKHTFTLNITDYQGQPVKTELTLAAVDEGIHGLTSYQSPDPYSHFARLRRPDLRFNHYYDRVVYDFEKLLPGGGDMALASRVAAPPMKNWIKPVAVWSGMVTSDENGLVTIEMDIPEYTGQLRMDAVVKNATATGSISDNIFVRRPYMLRTSLPRFLLPNDSIQSSAVVFNQTDQDCLVKLNWSTSGTLQDTQGSIELEIPAHAEKAYAANLITKKLVGQGYVNWKAEFFDKSGNSIEEVSEQLPIPVYPPLAFQARHALKVLPSGETFSFDNREMIADPRNKMEIMISANSLLRLKDALSFLVGYPYGCVEQTTSRLLPMFLLRKNQTLLKDSLADSRIDEYIRIGIERLLSMQTLSGGLGYWSGDTRPHKYGSIYAFHFLTLIKNDREYTIPEANYDALKKYVRFISQEWNKRSDYDMYIRAYALYVLALGGDSEALEQIQRFDTIAVPTTVRYLLAAALAMNTNDQKRIKFYLSKTPTKQFDSPNNSDSFGSEIRNVAVELMALQQIGEKTEKIALLAEKLISFLEQNRYGNTQETAFIVTALSGYLTGMAQGLSAASADIQFESMRESIKETEIFSAKEDGVLIQGKVTNTGSTPMYISMTSHGIPQDATPEEVNEGIRVQRQLMLGNVKFERTHFNQGELYIVDIQIDCPKTLDYVVVSDLLPAGLEIENPRLDPNAIPSGSLKAAVLPSHLEIRDDRVVLAFNQLRRGNHHFYYLVRAVTKGRYQYPPIQAECMYDAKIHSSSLPKTITVE